MDKIDRERRSRNMSRIRSSDTEPELRVRKALHRLGYRFRLHVKLLPGKPDIVLNKYGLVVFVHGCFWHRHEDCKYAYVPKSRVDFWANKFAQNTARDAVCQSALKELGWKVGVIWECETRREEVLDRKIAEIFENIK